MYTKELILSKAKIADAVNIKLGSMGSWAELCGDVEWVIPELETTCCGTCTGHCSGCFDSKDPKKSACYVKKSMMKYTKRNDDGTVGDIIKNECSVKLGHAYRTIAMTKYRKDLYKSLNLQLSKKKNKYEIVRINESGELTCYEDLELWCNLAAAHQETIFYLYSKNYSAIKEAIDKEAIPTNLFINVSVWHEYGIEEFLSMRKCKQIRAFVLLDKEWTKEKYAEHGIIIDSMCGAYDEKGKMNHLVTCTKCKICTNCNKKCTGCYEH